MEGEEGRGDALPKSSDTQEVEGLGYGSRALAYKGVLVNQEQLDKYLSSIYVALQHIFG